MSTDSDFLRFVFHRYINSGCRKCLIFFSKTPVILPVSPEVSGCGGSHEPFFLGATWPNIYATCISKKRNEPVADPQLNVFFNWASKDPSPDPDLALFFQWVTPSADMLRPEVSCQSLFGSCKYCNRTIPPIYGANGVFHLWEKSLRY